MKLFPFSRAMGFVIEDGDVKALLDEYRNELTTEYLNDLQSEEVKDV